MRGGGDNIDTVEIRHRFTRINAGFYGLIRHGFTGTRLRGDDNINTIFINFLCILCVLCGLNYINSVGSVTKELCG
jgi:hypothetical protein